MKTKFLFLILALLATALAVFVIVQRRGSTGGVDGRAAGPKQTATRHVARTSHVPAHYDDAPSLSSLGPTLSPEQFSGVTRAAYEAARKIPQTIAQLPCYCHCDQSLGHKSLHSCFEDDHAAHCAVCANEALTAYRLQTEQRLAPAQIRELIIAEYSNQ